MTDKETFTIEQVKLLKRIAELENALLDMWNQFSHCGYCCGLSALEKCCLTLKIFKSCEECNE